MLLKFSFTPWDVFLEGKECQENNTDDWTSQEQIIF